MPTLKIKMNDRVFGKVVSFLKSFREDELKFVIDDEVYQENKNYLQKELKEVQEGKADYLTMEELEAALNNVIRKNENRL